MRGSTDFTEHAPIASTEQFQGRLASGELMLALDIPAGFGRNVRRRSPAEIGGWVDGAMPFRAETARGYLQGVQHLYLTRLAAAQGRNMPAPASVATRFRYNQDFDSVNSLVPSTIALLLALVPAILMALAVVREKEFGSITNLYVTPVTRAEFTLGKQMPYVALAMVGFGVVAMMAWLLFGVPIKGSLAALIAGDAALRLCHDGLRTADLGVRQHTDCGAVRHRPDDGDPGNPVLGHVVARIVTVRCGRGDRGSVPDELLPADHRRHLYQSRWGLPSWAERCSSSRCSFRHS